MEKLGEDWLRVGKWGLKGLEIEGCFYRRSINDLIFSHVLEVKTPGDADAGANQHEY